jgi:hypothetical protein
MARWLRIRTPNGKVQFEVAADTGQQLGESSGVFEMREVLTRCVDTTVRL